MFPLGLFGIRHRSSDGHHVFGAGAPGDRGRNVGRVDVDVLVEPVGEQLRGSAPSGVKPTFELKVKVFVMFFFACLTFIVMFRFLQMF